MTGIDYCQFTAQAHILALFGAGFLTEDLSFDNPDMRRHHLDRVPYSFCNSDDDYVLCKPRP
jgi:hypothetical protein